MATVFFPPQMRDLTGGREQADVQPGSLRRVVAELEERFPGIAGRLLDGETLAAGLAVSIDSEVTNLGLLARVEAESQVHIVAAIGGG